jgi:hypothetical protein
MLTVTSLGNLSPTRYATAECELLLPPDTAEHYNGGTLLPSDCRRHEIKKMSIKYPSVALEGSTSA